MIGGHPSSAAKMQMGFEEEGVGARAPDREIGLGFGGGYGKITGSTGHPRIHG